MEPLNDMEPPKGKEGLDGHKTNEEEMLKQRWLSKTPNERHSPDHPNKEVISGLFNQENK